MRLRLAGVLALMACVLGSGIAPAAAQDTTATAPKPKVKSASPVEEVVVTAERHKSTVQSTSISITALSGAQLKARGITTVLDVVREIPGLSVRTAGPGQTEYEARGLSSTGGAAPTVGFYLNDVPMSPPAAAQTGKVVIDPNLYDINTIEVLRGPQGTLYGSGSMGGTVRVVTNQPQLGVYGGSIEGIASGTEGGGPNGTVNAAVNIPINDMLALRVVGSDIQRSGFIDRVVLNPFPNDTITRGNVLTAPVESDKKDVNTEAEKTFRASLLFQPDVDTKITTSVLYQDTRLGGYDEFDIPPGSPHLAHYEAFPIAEPFGDVLKIISLSAVHDFGWASLTSDTSYWERNEKQTQDASENIGNTFGYRPYVPLPYSEFDNTRQFSEEVRLASPEGQSRFRWVVGAFYSDLRSLWQEYSANPSPEIQAISAPVPNPPGLIFQAYNPYQIKQIAGFADGSVNITDTIQFATGLRVNRYESTLEINEWGAAFPGQISRPVKGTDVSTAATSVTPRFTLSWLPTKDFTGYVTASQGYRPGGLNQAVPAYCGGAPVAYNADSVWNYEIGEKARLFDGKLTINGDFYYDRWTNIQQLLLLNCGYEYYDNAGNGRTFGPELEVTAKLTPEWTLSGSGAYTDAEITSPVPILANAVIANALPGTNTSCPSISSCTLPILNVPKYTASVSLSYATDIFDKYRLTARITDNYIGPVVDEAYYPIINLPPYNLVNVRVTLAMDRWSAAFFVDNLTNKHAQLTANNTSFQFNTTSYYRVSTNQPLTGGIDLTYHF
jgi:outer membrane receptor protein involved in Fe transport